MMTRKLTYFYLLFLRRRTQRWIILALLACYLIWGSTFFAIQVALETFPPFFQMGSRFLAASILLFIWAFFKQHQWPSWQQWRDAFISGTLLIGGGMGLLACAQEYISSSLAAAMTMMEPLIICTLSIFLGWKASRKDLLGIAIGCIGILLLSIQGSFQAQPMGLIFMLGCVTCWSVGSVLLAYKLKLAPGAMGLASQMLCGALVLTFLSLYYGETPQVPTFSSLSAWLYLVLAGSLGAYCAYMYLIKHASPALYSSYNYVTPVIALLIGVIFAGEFLHWQEILAMGICLSGIVLLLSSKQ